MSKGRSDFETINCLYNNAEHKKCFARTENGRCLILSNCEFNDCKCHFYKQDINDKKL